MADNLSTPEKAILNTVLTEYPSPIANPARWMLEGVHRGDAMRHFWNGVLDTYEATLHFLALVQLKDYLSNGAPDVEFNLFLRKTLSKNLSLGHWAGLLRNLTQRLKIIDSDPILYGLQEMIEGQGWIETLKPLDSLVNERNKTRGHPDKFFEDKDFNALINKNRPILLQLLAGLHFLADLEVVGVSSWYGAGSMKIREAFVFRGKDADHFYQPDLGAELTISIGAEEREDLLLLRNTKTCIWLKLGPLAIFHQDFRLDIQDAYFFSSIDVKKDRIRNASFRSYSAGAPPLIRNQEEGGPGWLYMVAEWFNDRLKLDSDQLFSVEPRLIDTRNSRIMAMKQIGFVGREQLMAKIDHLLASGNIIHLKGPKGQGKSALAARITQRTLDQRRSILYCFFSRTGGTDAVGTALFHLIAQAVELKLVDESPSPDSSIDDLIKNLHSLLSDDPKNKKRKSIWLIIDGLDEAENNGVALQPLWDSFERTPLGNTNGILITGRQVSPIESCTHLELDGLSINDLREILFRHAITASEEFITKLKEGIEGNPLFLNRTIESLPHVPKLSDIPQLKGVAKIS